MTRPNDHSHYDRHGGGHQPSRRRKADKGLPDEAALADLARTYLEIQRRLWPEDSPLGALPPANPNTLAALVDGFRSRFLGTADPAVDPHTPPGRRGRSSPDRGAAYLRYSCDNSNPRSLDQQLRNVLERARRDGVFVPWEFVFADASVTGTTAARRRYDLAKAAVRAAHGPAVLYVDEMGRASRDQVESLQLGRRVAAAGKRMVGATDGFDSAQPNSKQLLTMSGTFHEMFVDQLRAKVTRGMADGFARGANLGKPAFGYRLVPMAGPDGSPAVGRDGRAVTAKAVDEAEKAQVLEGFRLFAEDRLSPERVARRFNEVKAGGMATWDGAMVRQLLNRETYFGVEYYGITRRVVDPDTGKVAIVRRPTGEWKRRDVPHLRIVPEDLEAKVRDRLAECRAAYRRKAEKSAAGPTRTSAYPTVLVRPVCGYCGADLCLGRAGKYASFCCLNGSAGKNGCGLTTYKTVSIVERAVVGHVRDAVLTPDMVPGLVNRANAHLAAEAARPKADAGPVRAAIKDCERRQARLVELCETGGAEVKAVAAKVKEIEIRLGELRRQLREVERAGEPVPPVTAADVEAAVADLHALLGGDPAAVAPVLREMTGPVTVTQKKNEGNRGAAWVAKFAVDLVPVVAHPTRRRDCPTAGTWEYLRTAGWKSARGCEVRVECVPRYATVAAEARSLADGGATALAIATTLGVSVDTARAAVRYARHGERPRTRPSGRKTGARTGPPKYQALAPDVARLRDCERVPFPRIAAELGIHEATARRAYDHFHRDEVAAAARAGRRFARGGYVRIPARGRKEIAARLAAGERPGAVAAAFGCGLGTVLRIRRGA